MAAVLSDLTTNMSSSMQRFVTLDDVAISSSADIGVWAAVLVGAVYAGYEVYQTAPHVVHKGSVELPATAEQMAHRLTRYDLGCIAFNKLSTVVCAYHQMQWAWWYAVWGGVAVRDVVLLPLQLLMLFAVYEAFYYWFHRALHIPAVYPLIHKHHHQQHAPFRGNRDAINAHPIEFAVGNYNHTLAAHLVNMVMPLHVVTLVVFIVVAGYFASLNHTRYNVMLHPWVFSVGAHDVHHRQDVRCNYGQYVMFWDVAFGTFRPNDPPADSGKLKAK